MAHPQLLDGLNYESKGEWRTPNSLKDSNVSPSRQWKKEESGHVL